MPLLTQSDIRTMTAADLDEVLAIEQASFRTPWKREHFESELSGRYSFPIVAECDGMVVGYLCLMSLFEEAQILDVAVAPQQRGRGIARALLEHAVTLSREKGAKVVALEVRNTNTSAIALYEKLEFVRIGCRPNYYEDSADAILMEKTLKETP